MNPSITAQGIRSLFVLVKTAGRLVEKGDKPASDDRRSVPLAVSLFRDHYNIPLVHRDASDLFLGKLAGVSDPERKRKIIGATFIEVFDEEVHKVGGTEFLAQGMLYPT